MSKITSLEDLFLEELKDLYSAESQLLKALPKMAQAAVCDDLRIALEEHREETLSHVERIEQAFRILGEKPVQVLCKAMKGLIQEGEEALHKTDVCPARDAAIIGAAQRVEHYEIAAYGTAHTHAIVLGYQRIQDLLQATLDEEKNADATLTAIAEGSVNVDATQPIAHTN